MKQKIAILPKLYDFNGDLTKKWYVYFSIRNPQTGKMVMKKVYTGLFRLKTQKERRVQAEKLITEYTLLIKQGHDFFSKQKGEIYTDNLQYANAAKIYKQRRRENKSFNFYASKYIEEQIYGLQKSTIQTYTSIFRITHQWLCSIQLEENDITTIDNAVMLRYFRYLDAERQLSAGVYNRYKNKLNCFFQWLMDNDIIAVNPIYRIPLISRQADMKPQPINPQQLTQVVEELKKDPELYLFTAFEYYCFMRPGKEILNMKIGWIDFGNCIVRIPKNFSKTQKEKKPIIPNQLMEMLIEDYELHTYPANYYVFGTDGKPGLKRRGKNTFGNRWRNIVRRLKLPPQYTLYSLKHTGNAMLKRSGATIFDRMMQNGHDSIKTTEIYDRDNFGFESQHIKLRFPDFG